MSARLASGLLVTALIRRMNAAGGIGTVLAKGDPDTGAILVVATERGADPQCWERGWDARGRDALVATGPTGDGEVAEYWQRRRERDRDLWVVELDGADAQRFAAETLAAN